MVWKKDLALDLAVSSIQIAPTDCRRLCLCGEKGSLVVMRLLDLTRDRCIIPYMHAALTALWAAVN